MASNTSGTGKSCGDGIYLVELFWKFSDDETARRWLEDMRWGEDGAGCPRCQSPAQVQSATHCPSLPRYCNNYYQNFNTRTRMVLAYSKIPLQRWVTGLYLQATNLQNASRMKLHRALSIAQKSAWFMTHRLRNAQEVETGVFEGQVEVDEAYIGGKHEYKKLKAERVTVGKTVVVGMKDRSANKVMAEMVSDTSEPTLPASARDNMISDVTAYTGKARVFTGMEHEAVKRSANKCVNEAAHTNGVESFWALFWRGYTGTYHKMSKKHLDWHVLELQATQ